MIIKKDLRTMNLQHFFLLSIAAKELNKRIHTILRSVTHLFFLVFFFSQFLSHFFFQYCLP